jgi:hypothetical protein
MRTKLSSKELEAAAKPGESWEDVERRLLAQRDDRPPPAKKPRSNVVPFTLPLWPDDERSAPAVILRSALFGAIRPGRRKYMSRQALASWKGDSVRYTGERLDQADLDVWLQCVHFARRTRLGLEVRFHLKAFLRELGRPAGGTAVEWLKTSLSRMNASAVAITARNQTYEGSLIQEAYSDESTGYYVVILNPTLAALFVAGHTRLSWEKRLALGKDQLAKWLYSYVGTHRATKSSPHRIAVTRLQELCGNESTARDFRYKLQAKMALLKNTGVVAEWRITGRDALEFWKPAAAEVGA